MHVWGNIYRTSKKLDIGIKVNLLIEIKPMLGCKCIAYNPPLQIYLGELIRAPTSSAAVWCMYLHLLEVGVGVDQWLWL